MSFQTSDLLQSFVEDCREHLSDIEELLLDMETSGADSDPELVNSVFRAAHSIKGGAAMLGFENMKELAHKLENVLDMVRGGTLTPTPDLVNTLLQGFDKLKDLVDNSEESEGMDTSEEQSKLKAIVSGGLGEEDKGLIDKKAAIPTAGSAMFDLDALTLKQATRAGEFVYLVEMDLVHDIQKKGLTPLDVLKEVMGTGRLLDCKIDIGAVGTLDDELTNRIPFYMLFATIIDPVIVSALFKIDQDQISTVSECGQQGEDTCIARQMVGPFEVTIRGDSAVVLLPPDVTGPSLADFKKALLKALDSCLNVRLEWSGVQNADFGCLQLICLAERTLAGMGGSLGGVATPPPNLRELAMQLGFKQCAFALENPAVCPYRT